jgi:hypothetical protein
MPGEWIGQEYAKRPSRPAAREDSSVFIEHPDSFAPDRRTQPTDPPAARDETPPVDPLSCHALRAPPFHLPLQTTTKAMTREKKESRKGNTGVNGFGTDARSV